MNQRKRTKAHPTGMLNGTDFEYLHDEVIIGKLSG